MINSKFEDIFTFQTLYKAHIKARESKRSKKSITKFELKTLSNIYKLYRELNAGNYKIKGYTHFAVFEPKRREIQALQYGDRVVQHVLCDELFMPYFSRHAIIDNCVCQVGKGMHFALKRFECALKKFTVKHKQNGYVLKCDILKYFPSIPHKQILEILKKHIKDKKILKLMEDIIDSFHTDISYLNKYNILPLYQNDNMLKTNRGLPIGNQTSQILGMFYLDSVDRYIKEKLKIKIYSRYMDDFILVHENFEVLKNALCIIKQLTQKLGLSLNSKTQIFPLKNGVTYLGFRYYVQKNGKVLKFVAKKTISRFKARAKLLNKAYFDGAINNQRVLQSVIAYHGHLAHGNCYWLERGLIKKIKVPLKSEIESSKKIKKMFLKVKHS